METSVRALAPPPAAAERLWECAYCKMVVSAAASGFAPGPEYAGPCSRNPDGNARCHCWVDATPDPQDP